MADTKTVQASEFFGDPSIKVNAPNVVSGADFMNPKPQDPSVQQMDNKLNSGFLSKVLKVVPDALKHGTEKTTEALTAGLQGKQGALETTGQLAGDTIGTGFDIVGGLASLAIPQSTKDFFSNLISKSPAAAALNSETGQKVIQKLKQVADDHPRAMRDLDAALNIASVVPAEKGVVAAGELAAKGVEATKPVVSEALGGAADAVEQAAKKRASAEALDIVAPKLSKLEKESAVAEGRATKGILGKVTVAPSLEDTRVADAVAGLVSKSKNPFENIKAIKADIAAASENLSQALAEHPGTFNNSEIKSAFAKAKDGSRVIFGSDKTLEKTYDAVTGEFMRILKEKGNTLKGVLDARQEFDKVIEDKFPGLLGNPAGDSLRRNAILDTRRAANQFVENKLPAGDAMREVLQRQTNQFTAVENIAKKAASQVDTGVIGRALNAVKDNPLVAGLTGFGVASGAGTIMGLLTNPAVVSSLILTGAYKVGKKILTSDMVTEYLVKALRAGEDVFKPSEKKAVQTLLDTITTVKP